MCFICEYEYEYEYCFPMAVAIMYDDDNNNNYYNNEGCEVPYRVVEFRVLSLSLFHFFSLSSLSHPSSLSFMSFLFPLISHSLPPSPLFLLSA